MDLSQYMKSIIDMDRASVVICNLNHEIIYMNSAAIGHYGKSGGAELIGKNLLNCHNEKENKDVYMVALRDDAQNLIGYYEKHEYRNPENARRYDFSQSLV